MNKALKKVIKTYKDCTACPLHKTARTHVFYRESDDKPETPDVLFIGEAPGNTESLIGEPFVGKAGELLNEWIGESADETRFLYSFGITNIVCCRPLDSETGKIRPPSKDEAKACSDRLTEMLEVLRPKVIILLGKVAASHYKMPGSLVGTPVLELQHPAYILRNGGYGSLTYTQNLVKLVDFLEANLYGQEASLQGSKVGSKQISQGSQKTRKRSKKRS